MKNNIFFCFLSLVFISSAVLTKNHFTDLVNEKLKNYALNEAPEKIYIHTDKPYYTLDEDIWFTGYLVDGITHEKTNKSWVFYVELINNDDKIVAKKKLFTNSISAAGDFKINKDWKPGNYLLRAYTSYMRNKNPDYFFQKKITVLDVKNIDSTKSTTNISTSKKENFSVTKPDLNFYPEGGYLVENIRCNVAIKIKNDFYSDIKLSGVIVDELNDVISEFSTLKFGLGAFTINPKPNKVYSAIVNVNGVEFTYKLPKALPNGYALSIVNSTNHFVINLKSNTKKGLSGTHLVLHQRGKLIYSKYEPDFKTINSIKIPTTDLKDGVSHATLFDASGNPVCERLLFISNPKNNTKIEITKSKEVLNKREQIKLNVNVKDNENQNISSRLSMSVRDLSTFPYSKYSKNIKTWLLLNSDLRGEIKDPGYFFEKEFDYKKRYLLDLVMLTHGWRRFTWKSILYDSKKPNAYPTEKGITISGTTKLLKKPYTGTQTKTRLTFLDKSILQEPIQETDKAGRFSYGPFIFFDSVKTIVESRLTNFKSKAPEDREVLIFINQENSSPKVIKNIIIENDIDNETKLANFLKMSEYIKQINFEFEKETQRLEEITILAKKREELSVRNKEMNSRTTHGSATNRLDLEDEGFNGNETIFDVLELMPGIRTDGFTSISVRGSSGNPTVLLDNFNVDVEFLSTILASEISFIDVLSGPEAIIYPNSANGVIALYSKSGNISKTRNVKRSPGIIDFSAEGFYTAREFYAPDHANGFEEKMKADIRTTLHWEPVIKTTEYQGEDISFFSSDSEGDYLIEIEGISNSGIPLHTTSTFSVK